MLVVRNEKTAGAMALRIQEAFRSPFEVEGRLTYAGASIGIALYPNDASDLEGLLRSADTAMYRAKAGGKQGYQFFSPEMNREIVEKVALECALRQALDRQELTLCYQPQLDLQTGSRCVVEVLARWRHPELGEISPARFIPLAESSGLIFRLGEWVLRTACTQAKVWAEAGCPVERVAVNISGHQLRQPDFPDLISRILSETKLDPVNLELEFTESVLMEHAGQTLATLQALKGMGIQLSIDDFGTGYSSLTYLKYFPVDRIKIDRAFVAGIELDPGDTAIVTAVIALAHTMKIKVLAEGVETPAQLEFLQGSGCSEVQGFLLGRPMPAEELVRWLGSEGFAQKAGKGQDGQVAKAVVSLPRPFQSEKRSVLKEEGRGSG
jgi:EAL domain-containing protein (putative c-di-GMP-specific phosphodiesterase class I)